MIRPPPRSTLFPSPTLSRSIEVTAVAGKREGVGCDGAAGDRAAKEFVLAGGGGVERRGTIGEDRKSTRLNSSHLVISYAVFCLKKKKHMDNVLLERPFFEQQ